MGIVKKYIYRAVIALIILLCTSTCVLHKQWKHEREERKREASNGEQLRKIDSLKYASLIYTEQQMREYLEYENKSLLEKLNRDGIDYDKIQRIINTSVRNIDLTQKEYNFDYLIDSIRAGRNAKKRFTDESGCFVFSGELQYTNDTLRFVVDKREFKDELNVVLYEQRKQWKFGPIKSRFLGKKEVVPKVYSDCGSDVKVKDIQRQKTK